MEEGSWKAANPASTGAWHRQFPPRFHTGEPAPGTKAQRLPDWGQPGLLYCQPGPAPPPRWSGSISTKHRGGYGSGSRPFLTLRIESRRFRSLVPGNRRQWQQAGTLQQAEGRPGPASNTRTRGEEAAEDRASSQGWERGLKTPPSCPRWDPAPFRPFRGQVQGPNCVPAGAVRLRCRGTERSESAVLASREEAGQG